SACEIRKELSLKADGNYPSYSSHMAGKSVAWLKGLCEDRAIREAALEKEQLEFAQQQVLVDKLLSKNRKAVLTCVSFAILVVITITGIIYASAPSWYEFVLIAGMVAGGATGAFARDIIWVTETKSSVMSLALGCIAGFVVGLSYLIPQWIGAHGFLESTAARVPPEGKIQFVSAILVALSAGVGFDAIFNNLKKRAEDLPVGLKP